jgi:hypothetical protein
VFPLGPTRMKTAAAFTDCVARALPADPAN